MTVPIHGFPDYEKSLDRADTLLSSGTQAIAAAGSFDIPSLDMRTFESYTLFMQSVNFVPATAWNGIVASMGWTPIGAAGGMRYLEQYEWFTNGQGSVGFPNDEGGIVIQDHVHHAFLNVRVFNEGADQVTFSWEAHGHARPMTRRHMLVYRTDAMQNRRAYRGQLLTLNAALGAGGTSDTLLQIAPGLVSMRQQAVTAPMVMQFLSPTGASIQGWNIAAGVESHTLAGLPRMQVRASVVNSGGVGGTAVWEITSVGEDW